METIRKIVEVLQQPTALPFNDNGAFDVPMYLLNAYVDPASRFSDGELPSINTLNAFLNCKLELKSMVQAINTGNLFIEFEIDNRGDGVITRSGISTTESDFYWCNITDDLIIIPSVPMLKWFVDNKEDLGLQVKSNASHATDHIGYGIIIPLSELMALHLKYQYYKNVRRGAEVYQQLRNRNNLGNQNLEGNTN